MEDLSNEVLAVAYKQALEQKLSKDFIAIFEVELAKRNLLLEVKNQINRVDI